MEIAAPAKINLYLRVIKKLEDGYHQIETIFERISILDRVKAELSSSGTSISCSDENIPTGEESLLGRTVRSFRQRASLQEDFRVHIEKNIPVSAGMGGGSSDAAAVLILLNQLAGAPLGALELAEIGASLGADIPFFLSGYSYARGTGRGDVIEKVEDDRQLWHVVVTPPFGVSTKEVYGKIPAFTLTKNRLVDKMFTAFLRSNNIKGIPENFRNDLQDIVLREFPSLKRVFTALRSAGARGVLLSGSGPTVFGIFDREKADDAARYIRGEFPEDKWRIQTARTY
ncbi:MAG: 4-(cytidine 5'-diphospho)-2-C-methyl-D-erythritol kinase [Candidatus Omnitrophica bacterium]|nr:4-(cytidine 5'-diphospho)-2-C-methyl-D-erythritol kinase [Candidatus Omnitrophota bacterium]